MLIDGKLPPQPAFETLSNTGMSLTGQLHVHDVYVCVGAQPHQAARHLCPSKHHILCMHSVCILYLLSLLNAVHAGRKRQGVKLYNSDFMGIPLRLIDTPGLDMSSAEMASSLDKLATIK